MSKGTEWEFKMRHLDRSANHRLKPFSFEILSAMKIRKLKKKLNYS